MYVIKQSKEDTYVFMNKYCFTREEAEFWLDEYNLAERGWAIYVY